MRRTLIMAVVVAVALAGTAIRIKAQSAPAQPTNQQIAQKILDSRASQYMTAPAHMALEMAAHGDRLLGHDASFRGTSPSGKPQQAKGGHFPAGSGLMNVRVNNPAEDTNQVDQTTQSETSVAVAGQNVAVGFNDSQTTLQPFFTAGSDLTGYAYSRNGGQTFVDGGALPNPPGNANIGDPWLTNDRAGNMYYSTLTTDALSGALEVGVARSTDGGKSWSTPVIVSPTSNEFADKDALTAGPSVGNPQSDTLYDTWDDQFFDPNTQTVYAGLPVSRSTDGGATWQLTYADKIPLFSFNGPPTCSFAQYIGAQPLVDRATGALYVAAEKISVDDPNCTFNVPVQFSEMITVSHDGGQSFSTPVKIADVTSATQFGALILGRTQYMRTIEFPTLALSGGALYATWNDGGASVAPSYNSHIRLAKSTDGGQTWTTSWVTSGDGDELQPSISADTSGLHIAYYQRNADNTLDVNVSSSTDGSSWTAQRVTSQSFPGVSTVPQFDPIISWGYMGDYIANVSDGSHQYIAWGDNRDVVTNFLFPQGRHDPDVFFARQ